MSLDLSPDCTSADTAYAQLIRDCLAGERITTRNAPVFRVIDRRVRFDTTPLVTLRRTPWKTALREWQWFMSGSSNIADLHPSVLPWWQPWADENGEIKNNYSRQFRHFEDGTPGGFDQIAHMIEGIRMHPFSRRNILTTWNPAEMASPKTPITNCHNTLTMATVDRDGRLSLSTTQRSVDVIVGLPANWIQMSAFLLYLCARTGYLPGSLTWTGIDVHVYEEHADLASRIVDTLPQSRPAPTLVYRPTSDDFLADDFSLDGEYAPLIEEKARMIV